MPEGRKGLTSRLCDIVKGFTMAKITLNNITNTNQVSVINDNFDKIENELQNKVLYRDNPNNEPNPLVTDVDVNQRRLYNLPTPVLSHQAARLKDVQNAISGATQANLISFTPYGSISADTVQGAIQEIVDEMPTGGGGGGEAAPGGVTLSDFVIDATTANSRVVFTDTVPAGWNINAGRCTVSFDFLSNAYFQANPTGHIAVVTRANTDVIATSVFGTGVWIGYLVGVTNANDYAPSMGLETWANGVMPNNNYLFRYSGSPRNILLKDAQQYRVVIESTKTTAGERFIRYKLYEREAVSEYWKLLNDTGDVLDHNRWADLTKHGLVFAHVFGSNLVPWSLSFTNVKVTWNAAPAAVSDATNRLSRFGADLEGDLTLQGNARRIRVNNTGSNAVNWTSFQTTNSNASTSVMVIPNGTSTTCNFFAVNSSNPASSYRAATFGMAGGEALIETFNLGQVDPTFNINIGPANTVARFKTTGLNILNAARDIGQPVESYTFMSQWGGSSAKSFTDGTVFNVDSVCTVGTIRTFMSATPTNEQVENALRPLYCIVSTLYKELKDKKVI
jgi:hypothetical protein